MRIFQVLSNFLPDKIAGTEVYTWALSKHLQKMGHEVQVIIPNYGKTTAIKYVYDEIAVHRYAENSIVDRELIMGRRAANGLSKFAEYIQEQKPDIIHFHEISGSNGITLKHVQAAKLSGAKVVFTFHLANYSCKTGTLVFKNRDLCDGLIDIYKCSNCFLHSNGYQILSPFIVGLSILSYKASLDTLKWNNKVGTALGTVSILAKNKADLNTLVSSCDQVITIAHWYKQMLLRNGIASNKITFISQGLPVSNTSKSLQTNNLKSPLRLLFLGRVSKFKGLHLLIKALKKIDPKSVSLSIYGQTDDPVYESKLRYQTKHLSHIHWKGILNQQEVLETMIQHDILCLCSTFSEMSPLVIQEAFAAGIPIIASKVYGNMEQVKHGIDGLLFNFNDAKDLRYQIQKCINNPQILHRLSNNIQLNRSISQVGEDHLKLYNQVLSK